MTAIAAIEVRGEAPGVWLAWDSCTSSEDSRYADSATKVWLAGGKTYAIGCAGDTSFADAVRYMTHVPLPGDNVHRWACEGFVRRLRKHSESRDLKRDEWGDTLIATRGQLVLVDSSLGVSLPSCGYMAIGSGGHVALGALHAMRTSRMSPEQKVVRAVDAACQFVPSCAPPVRTLWVPAL